MVALNTISQDYPRIISKVDIGKGGIAFLYHPSLTMTNSRTLSLGRVVWAQFQLHTTTLSIAVVYAPSDLVRARTFLWHQLKDELSDSQWVILDDFNMIEEPIDSSGPSPLLSGR